MFIDIAKLLFQKDTRDALKELVALIRKKPEWQADLITLKISPHLATRDL